MIFNEILGVAILEVFKSIQGKIRTVLLRFDAEYLYRQHSCNRGINRKPAKALMLFSVRFTTKGRISLRELEIAKSVINITPDLTKRLTLYFLYRKSLTESTLILTCIEKFAESQWNRYKNCPVRCCGYRIATEGGAGDVNA